MYHLIGMVLLCAQVQARRGKKAREPPSENGIFAQERTKRKAFWDSIPTFVLKYSPGRPELPAFSPFLLMCGSALNLSSAEHQDSEFESA